MGDRVEELHVELAELLAQHEPTLTDDDRATLVRLEEGYGWRPGRRPVRPAPNIAAFLDLIVRLAAVTLRSVTRLGAQELDVQPARRTSAHAQIENVFAIV